LISWVSVERARARITALPLPLLRRLLRERLRARVTRRVLLLRLLLRVRPRARARVRLKAKEKARPRAREKARARITPRPDRFAPVVAHVRLAASGVRLVVSKHRPPSAGSV